ncbi:potassium channel family protein [Candidatus Poriferisocius sp.]|uniref:potassium channel family protein n=1 Tax=Candidatus Poriferisocius sp. TaxID=3101276 RepID=UPI003B5B9413
MDDRPRNLRAMLAEAKDLSELMVDLAYAALYFDDPDMATEVDDLEVQMTELVQDMRAVCIMAVRHPREAEGMSSVLQVISAIERIANDAVDISRIVTRRLGIPAELVADMSNAEEVSHRLVVREGSHMVGRPLGDLELPVVAGMRVMAIKRDRSWITDVGGDQLLMPGDVLFLRGSPAGIVKLHQLAAAPTWEERSAPEDPWFSDLHRAVEVLVEMKDLSEAAVGLAYSALVLNDRGLAAEVQQLEGRLDEMNHQLELWVLRAAADNIDPAPLRGLLHLGQAAEDIGDQARQMVLLVEQGEEVHPILEIALGDSDEVVVDLPVAPGSGADGSSLRELALGIEPGFTVLAIRRGGRYLYRPRGRTVLAADDQIIASGPDEGREALAARFGWHLVRDEEGLEDTLQPLTP